jgi:hypothetical protein
MEVKCLQGREDDMRIVTHDVGQFVNECPTQLRCDLSQKRLDESGRGIEVKAREIPR